MDEIEKENKHAVLNGVVLEEEEVDTEETPEPDVVVTEGKSWQQASLKMFVVAMSTLCVIAILGGMVLNTISTINTASKTQPTQTPTPTDNAEKEQGIDKTNAALAQQKGELREYNSKITPILTSQPTNQPIPQPAPQPKKGELRNHNSRITPTPTSQPTPKPTLKKEVEPSSSIKVVRQLLMPRTSLIPKFQAKPEISSKAPTIDPMQQWLLVANIGYWGTKTGDRERSSLIPRFNSYSNFPNTKSQAPTSKSQRILIGTTATGKLQNSIAWGQTSSQQNQNFLIKLSSSLKASDGRVAIPENAYVIAKLISTDNTGLLKMSIVSFMINKKSQTIERKIPENTISVQGDKGQPIIAKSQQHNQIGKALVSSVLSGISKAAEVTNQSLITSSNGLSYTASSGRNIGAGFLQGSSSEIARNIQSSTEQNLQSLRYESKVFIVKSGTPVQLFVNESFDLEEEGTFNIINKLEE